MASAQEVRKLMLSYLSGEISASEFANLFAPMFKAFVKSSDESVKKLALAVHGQISHYFAGLFAEGEFRSNLSSLAQAPINVVIGVPSANLSVNRYQVIERAFAGQRAASEEGVYAPD